MSFIREMGSRIFRWKCGKIERFLCGEAPEKIERAGEQLALQAFHRAAKRVPAYAKMLSDRGVDPAGVQTIDDFRRKVPILDKVDIFRDNQLRDLCVDGNLDGVASFHCSSGHTGEFSYGVDTAYSNRGCSRGLMFAFQQSMRVLERKTFLINCLPMGARIPCSMPFADTGTRADVILALIRKLAGEFEQFIIVGGHLLIKKVIEEGPDYGIDWKKLRVYVVTGSEYIAESYRDYLASLLGTDFDRPEKGMILVNFGLSELSLSLFHEDPDTIRIRRLARSDGAVQKALYGRRTSVPYNIMQYNPYSSFIESIPDADGRGRLVVTLLDRRLKLPLIRYNTKDVVESMSYRRLGEVLSQFGQERLMPSFHLPVAIALGKGQACTTKGGRVIFPDEVKEALHVDFDIAAMVTGNFRLVTQDEQIRLLVQLRKVAKGSAAAGARLAGRVREYSGCEVDVSLIPYEEFPCGLELDYERKCRYVEETHEGSQPSGKDKTNVTIAK